MRGSPQKRDGRALPPQLPPNRTERSADSCHSSLATLLFVARVGTERNVPQAINRWSRLGRERTGPEIDHAGVPSAASQMAQSAVRRRDVQAPRIYDAAVLTAVVDHQHYAR